MKRAGALLALLAGSCAAAPDEFSSVAGVVVDGISGKPLARVRVSLAPVEYRDREISATTAADGRFLFAGVERGKFQLTAERAGYATQRYGASEDGGGFSVSIVTGPGEYLKASLIEL